MSLHILCLWAYTLVYEPTHLCLPAIHLCMNFHIYVWAYKSVYKLAYLCMSPNIYGKLSHFNSFPMFCFTFWRFQTQDQQIVQIKILSGTDRSVQAKSGDSGQTGPLGAVWSESTLFAKSIANFGHIPALWNQTFPFFGQPLAGINLGVPIFGIFTVMLHTDWEDSLQAVWMHWLIWDFSVCSCYERRHGRVVRAARLWCWESP